MKKHFLLAMVLFFGIAACGSSNSGNGNGNGGGGSSDRTVILSPANMATDIAIDAAVTAVFSAAITEPSASEWLSFFTLQKDGTGNNICTSVTYDASILTATCVHADMDNDTSYTSLITSLTGVRDSSATFTTAEAL